MKEILQRLFRHEELTRSEACQVMKDITRGDCPDVQIAALLTAFSMRSVVVDELLGFRETIMMLLIS